MEQIPAEVLELARRVKGKPIAWLKHPSVWRIIFEDGRKLVFPIPRDGMAPFPSSTSQPSAPGEADMPISEEPDSGEGSAAEESARKRKRKN